MLKMILIRSLLSVGHLFSECSFFNHSTSSSYCTLSNWWFHFHVLFSRYLRSIVCSFVHHHHHHWPDNSNCHIFSSFLTNRTVAICSSSSVVVFNQNEYCSHTSKMKKIAWLVEYDDVLWLLLTYRRQHSREHHRYRTVHRVVLVLWWSFSTTTNWIKERKRAVAYIQVRWCYSFFCCWTITKTTKRNP